MRRLTLIDDEHRPLHVGVQMERARSILTRTSGFISDAGFTHSLTPARNCTYGCWSCYVPNLRVCAGLKREDWTQWGAFTTFKTNAPDLLSKTLRPDQIIYCSPLVDPYQPAEADVGLMRAILEEVARRSPRVFVIQTRAPLIVRDLDLITALARKTTVRVSFSLTTNRDEIRRRYEPHCAPIVERLNCIASLREAGLQVFATLAPLLPCDPEELARLALETTDRDIIADPLHSRDNRRHGAVTHAPACRLSDRLDEARWHDAAFQTSVVSRMRAVVEAAGRRLETGPAGFAFLAGD